MSQRSSRTALLVLSMVLLSCDGVREGGGTDGTGGNARRNSAGEAVTDAARVSGIRSRVLDAACIDSFISAGGIVLLEFGGKRCSACRRMRDTLDDLLTLHDEIRVGYVYWEDAPELFERWKIGLIPAQVVVDATGRERLRHVGSWDVAGMSAAIDTLESPPGR